MTNNTKKNTTKFPNFENTIYEGTAITDSDDQNLLQNKKRVLTNLFYSIINYSSATIFEPKAIGELFKQYGNILSEKYNTSEKFNKSMLNTLKCFREPEKINGYIAKLEKDSPDSFLVLPMFDRIHTLTAVIRKQEDGLKFYAIDKFTKHSGGLKSLIPYAREYVIKDGMENKLIDELNSKAFEKDPIEIIEKYASKRYDLKIKHSEQKVFTCLYKEPEAGIKFAFATRNLDKTEFKKLREENKFSKNFSIKWDESKNSTINIHKAFLEKLKDSNKDVDFSHLDKVFKNYVENKMFRRELRKSKDFNKALELAFDKENKLEDLPKKEKVRRLIKKINLDTVSQVNILRNEFSDILSFEEKNNLLKAANNVNLVGTYAYIFTNSDLDKVQKRIEKIEEKFPVFAKQAKDYHSLVNNCVAYALFEMYIKKNKSMIDIKDSEFDWIVSKVDKAIEMGPYSDKAHFTKGVFKINRGITLQSKGRFEEGNSLIKESAESFKKAIKLNPNDAVAKAYLAVSYKNLEQLSKAEDIFKDINKTHIKIDDNLKIFVNGKKFPFNCMTKEVLSDIKSLKKQTRSNESEILLKNLK